MKESCVIFDLDGTLCELKLEHNKNIHTWYELPIINMLDKLESEWYMLDVNIYILTGRKEKHRYITIAWLEKYNIKYEYLIMQDWNTAQKNHIFKEEKLKEILKEKNIRMVYDDNPEVGEVCKRLKIPFYPCY